MYLPMYQIPSFGPHYAQIKASSFADIPRQKFEAVSLGCVGKSRHDVVGHTWAVTMGDLASSL